MRTSRKRYWPGCHDVSNVDQILPFYQDILGLPLLFRSGSNLAFFSMGPVRLMLTTPQGRERPGKTAFSIFGFRIWNTPTMPWCNKGHSISVVPNSPPECPDHELWMAFVRDPDGNLIGLIEEKYPTDEGK